MHTPQNQSTLTPLKAIEVIDSGVFSDCEVTLIISSDEERIYHCQQSLRLLPGRRLTALATCGKKKYVVKIFPRRRRALADYEDEIKGYELLHHASFEVPDRIYYGHALDGVNLIVYQYVSRARTLKQVFQEKPESRSAKSILSRFIGLFAQLHRDSLVHEDPHLDNFLVKGDKIVTLDAGAVRQVHNEGLLDKNLALTVAQFPLSWHMEQHWLDTYLAAMNVVDDAHRNELQLQISRQQDWREKHVLKKIYRECTAFHVRSTLRGKTIIDRGYLEDGLLEHLSEPQSVFDLDGVIMLKEGNSSTVGIVPIGDRQYVIKRYNVKHFGHRLKQMLRESRASRSWRNAHRLQLRGVRTAKPVAMVECLKGRLKRVSLFVMEYVPGVSSAEFFRQEDVTNKVKNEVAIKMLDMLNELKVQHLVHGDVKSTNFIISEDKPVLIDLDAMCLHKNQRSLERGVKKDRLRFRENWINDPEPKAMFELLMNANQG